MFKKIFILFITLVLFTIGTTYADEDSIDLHFKTFDSASVNGAYYPLDATDFYNPASMTEFKKYNISSSVSTGIGKTSFPKGNIDYNFKGIQGKIFKNLYLGANWYDTKVSVDFIEGQLKGSNVKVNTPASEILAAYKINKKISIGAAIISGENSDMFLSKNGINLAKCNMNTKYNYRLGLMYDVSRKIKIGSVFNKSENNFHLTMNPAMTGLSNPVIVKDSCTSTHWTHGIVFSSNKATSVFYNHRFSTYKRFRIDKTFKTNYPYYGIKQWISPKIKLQFAYLDKNPEAMISYFNQNGWNANLAYRKGKRLKGFGENDTYFFSLVKTW